MKYLITVSITILVITFLPLNASASSGPSGISYETVNPDSIFYPLKRQWEKINLDFFYRDGEGKDNYYKQLLEVRYKELVYVAENKKLSQFEQAGSRYNTTAGFLIDSYSAKDEALKKKLDNYQKTFETLGQNYEEFAYRSLLKQAFDISAMLKEKM